MFAVVGVVIATLFGILFLAPGWLSQPGSTHHARDQLSQPGSTHPFSFAITSSGSGEVGFAIFDPPKGSQVSGNTSWYGTGPIDWWWNDSQGNSSDIGAIGGGLGMFNFPANDPPYTISFKSLGGPETWYISGSIST
jgi:hypothetical protein